MRRNTIRLLKYLVLVIVCLLGAPAAMKLMLGDDVNAPPEDIALNAPRGLPVDPVKADTHNDAVRATVAGSELIKIDWHDYKHLAEEKQRSG